VSSADLLDILSNGNQPKTVARWLCAFRDTLHLTLFILESIISIVTFARTWNLTKVYHISISVFSSKNLDTTSSVLVSSFMNNRCHFGN
jgi:hypothetical protein